MKLKKITIIGFKSFADKTVLQFDEGITCIVGPNGCGKSNIADAFRWVLGEQSAKSMRGMKMPDVIFAGTVQRKPLNFAEVSLTLTDLQGALPVEYEEITITRRLHRNGESEYLLNGNVVRLKDLQGLFLDSGVGKNAFSIFEQGKLDQVISYSPIERRYIFEEAAGILRFLQRKKEALKRLEQAEVNFSRVRDIYLEVEKQIHVLEKQAQKARLYKDQKNSLEHLEKASYILKWQGFKKKQADIEQRQQHQHELLIKSRQEETAYHAQCQEAKQIKAQHEKDLRGQNEKLLSVRNQQEIQSRECLSLQQRFKEAEYRQKKLKQEQDELAIAHKTRQQSLAELGSKSKNLEKEWGDAEAGWHNQQDLVKEQERELQELRRQCSVKQQSFLKCDQQHNQLQSEIKQLEIRLENGLERQNQLDARAQKLCAELKQSSLIAKEKKQQLQQLSDLIDVHKKHLQKHEEEIKRHTLQGDEKQKEIDLCRRKGMENKARQRVLQRMREENEGFSSGSKKLLQESQNPKSSLYQILRPLYEYFKPEPEAVEALAAVLHKYSQTLVVETEKEFMQVLTFAQQKELHDFSLLCLEWLGSFSKQTSVENALLNRVEQNSFSKHFLSHVTLQTSTEHVVGSQLKCPDSWCKQGFLVDHLGVLFKVKPNENQVFYRESELRSLEEEILIGDERLSSLEQAFQQIQQQRVQLQITRGELDQSLRRDEMKLVEVNFALQRALSDQEKYSAEQAHCEQESKNLKDNRLQQQQSHLSLEQEFIKIKNDLAQLQNEKNFLHQQLENQEKVLKKLVQEKMEKGAVYQQLAQNRQQIVHQCQLLEIKGQEHEKNVRRVEDEIKEYEERLSDILKEEKEGLARLSLLEKECQLAAKMYAEMEKKGEMLLHECDRTDQQWALHQGKIKGIESEISHLQVQIAQHQTSTQSIEEELLERYQLSMEAALQVISTLPRSLDQTERQIRELRQSIQDSGDVNLTAIEDLEKTQEREGFLKQQMGDMQQSKEELLSLIQDLDGESKKVFSDTFEQIRQNFKKNFEILFTGGEADLHFTDSKDVLEAGIEISARPPGKQMRSITLLSGGEKCLTAVALLFAIFEVKPAPFCILDEIDAPLDDANVERFVNVVKHFVDRCQFLIITHNKRTMSIGDVLFGVSMEERGVSKLLTLEFAKEESPEVSLVR